MPDRYHTVILVPHTRAKLRKWRVTVGQLRAFVAVLAIAFIGAGIALWSYFHSSVDQDKITFLRQENESLRETNRTFEDNLRRLQEQLATYEDRTRQLAIVAGIQTDVGSAGGIGGDTAEGEDVLESSIAAMELRSYKVGDELDAIEESLEERRHWMASTPAIAPVRGIMTSGFGNRRDPVHGRRAFHPALDISAPAGHPVVAPAGGIVLRAAPSGGLGKAVYLSHGYGLTTRYGHMSRLAVKAGQQVKRGDVIGYVGNTGRSTGYHLHYEVHLDGQPVDPLGYILPSGSR